MGLGKRNVVTADLKNYVSIILGEPKIGKTTLVKNIVKEITGTSDKILMCELKGETGYEAIDGLIYEAPQNMDELNEIVDEFLEGNHDFEYFALDTINELCTMTDNKTLKDHYKQNGEPAQSVNASFGGYGAGAKHSYGMSEEIIDKFKRSPYGLFLVGHNKVKSETKENGQSYDIVTSDLFSNYYGAFAKKATIICNIITETDVSENEKLNNSVRMMHFRSGSFVKAGSRFKHIQEKIEYGAENFVKVFNEAVKKSKEDYSEDDEFKEVKNVPSDAMTQAKTTDEFISEILEVTKELQSKMDNANKAIMEVLTEHDVKNPNKIEDKKVAESVLNDLEDLL